MQYSAGIADHLSTIISTDRLTRAMNAVTDPATGDTVSASVLDGSDANCIPYNPFQIAV